MKTKMEMEMKTISKEELNIILEKHKHWLNKNCESWKGLRADLHGADLCEADLHGADLCEADLCGADLCEADLHGADLCEADLCGADLCGADLCGADLRGADLHGADLHGADLHGANLYEADLRGADLHGADLHGADLHGANLYEADLCGANLCGADLRGANLYEANLYEADLRGAKCVPYIPMICPEEGAFIGWKKTKILGKQMIVKLNIPKSAKRLSSTSRKCRCNKAKVLEIYNLDGTVAEERKCNSIYDINFIYEVGKTVKVGDFNEDRWDECSQGIHFFMNRQEAINYN